MESNAPSPPPSSGGSSSSSAPVNGVSPSPAAIAAAGPPPFLSKTYEMVDDPSTDAIVSWGAGNNSFVVWNTPEFARDLLPKYFKHNNFSSFVRQLNTYGFRKIDPDRWEFANEGFLRGQKHLLKTISRRKSSHSQSNSSGPHVHQANNNNHHNHVQNHIQNQNASQNPNVASCVEVGKFGLEEEIERLKRDKNVLMQELVRLRQQQQSTDHQLQTLGKRLQGMELRQQQMMSFLAKAMQSPGFLAQFVQQNDPNRRIANVTKKRRLPKQGVVADPTIPNPNFTENGQIIKFQPLINEAAKAMLMKIMSMDSTNPNPNPRVEGSGFLIENPNPNPNPRVEGSGFFLENPNSDSNPNRSSGVTLAEVAPASSAFSAICAASPEIQSAVENPEFISGIDSNLGVEFQTLQDIENGLMNPDPDLFLNPIMEDSDEAVPIDTDELMYGEDDHKLPGIIDSFWEQFLNTSTICGDNEETESNINNNEGHVENLTEQMGLLSSEPKM